MRVPALRGEGAESHAVDPVLVVTPWWRPVMGGVVEVAERLHRLLLGEGVDVHLLVCDTEDWWSPVGRDPATPGVWHRAVPASAFSRPRVKSLAATVIRGVPALWQLSRFLDRRRIRTVLLLFPIDYAWPFVVLCRAKGISLIASLHGNDVTKYATTPVFSRWLLRRVLCNSDAIIVCASHLGQAARSIVAGKVLPIFFIPNCVDVKHFASPPVGFRQVGGPPTIVHISTFASKKRTIDIVEALTHPSIPSDARLIMVGDGAEFAATVERVHALALESRVEFVGAQTDVRPYLWKADVFVLASDDEGAPLALLEAMACGVPWVSTPWGAAADLPAGECGLTVPPRCPEQLGAALAQLIRDPEGRVAMGNRGRQRATTDFAEGQYVERHLAVIHRVQQTP